MGTKKIGKVHAVISKPERGGASAGRLFLSAVLFGLSVLHGAAAGGTNQLAEFERANKLYEQGKFREAVTAYEGLAANGVPTANVWFNLGNASYKSGQMGRAVAAYRMAERLTPRDSALRANLQFVRGKIFSDERMRIPVWKKMVRTATLNEWTALAAISFWSFFAALALGEMMGRRPIKTLLVFFFCVLLSGTALAIAVCERRAREAVVIAREVTVRFGPLDESQPAFQLRDGAEVKVIDAKGDWLEVLDAEKRGGWMRREEAVVLPSVSIGPHATTAS